MKRQARPWVAVAAALGLLGVLGAAILDDYGVAPDDPVQRGLGHATLALARGDEAAFRERLGPNFEHLRHYGTAFEAPLALIERALGQTDSRDVYLTRHLLTHLLFLVGAGAAALLAHRLFGGTWPALLALAAFALHPRLYAHSFFNTKDAPFAALFMVCLALAERAFRRGTAGAYALLGVGVGVLVNLRVMGALLFAAVLALNALDMALARGRPARRRALTHGVAFTAAAALALYAVSPYLWRDPSRLLDAFASLSQHPYTITTLFAGTGVRWPGIPAHYVPTWVAATTPPALLALGLGGVVAALAHGRCRSLSPSLPAGRALANRPPRFGLLLVACPAATVLAVAAVDANVFSGWRQLHFLWAPLAMLAALGLRWLAGAGRRRALSRSALGLACAGVAIGAAQVALLHPQQHAYFNLLADRDVPERLATWYETDFGRMAYQRALEQVLSAYPGATVQLPERANGRIFPALEQRRLVFDGAAGAADITLYNRRRFEHAPWIGRLFAPTALTLRVYDNTFFTAAALDVSLLGDATRETWRAAHRTAATKAPAAYSDYDLHPTPGALTWLKTPCGAADTAGEFASTASPADGSPAASFACEFDRCGVRIDESCMVRTPLPWGGGGPLKTLVAGQRLRHDTDLWRVAVTTQPTGTTAKDVTRPTTPGEVVARSHFDLFLDGAKLTYVKAPCSPKDTAARFFLHVFPVDRGALPAQRGRSGFDNLDFSMAHHDTSLIARLGGRCVASAQLPDYPIARLRTGQFGPHPAQWTVELREPRLPDP